MSAAEDEAQARAWLQARGVSRETVERLDRFATLLRHWTRRVNLVSPGTVDALWTRHILDSAQLHAAAPSEARHWLDIGSGGGLPGIVCAVLAAEVSPATRFTLVESDRRKCAFLSACVRELGLAARVEPGRIEALPPLGADVISARAVAPLDRLFSLATPHGTSNTTYLFPKGTRHAEEIDAARARWRFTVETLESITDPAARILRCRVQGAI